MRRFINQYVDLNAQVDKTSEADAGTTSYSRLSAMNLETLRLATAKLLQSTAGPAVTNGTGTDLAECNH